MPTEVTDVGPCKRRISISIPADEVKKAFSTAWQHARRNVQIKGFRPGKVPNSILEKRYGTYVQQEVKEHLINDAFRSAIDKHSLRPLAIPQIDAEEIELTPEKPFEFELEVEVQPDFELPDYKGIEVGAPPVQIEDEHVDRELEQLRAGHATIEKLEEGVASKGDYLLVDASYRVDGAVVIHHEDVVADTNRDMIDGIQVDGGTDAFAGKAAGAVVTVGCTLPDDFEPSGFAGAQCELLCTVKEIRRVQLPELNDEFATQVGTENLDDLRAKMREQIEHHMGNQRNRYIEERILDELIKRTPFELPQDILDRATHDGVHRLEHQMEHGGMEAAEAKANAASHTQRIREDEARGLRVGFLVDRISQAEKLSVTENELEQAIYQLAAVQKRDVQDVYDELVNSQGLHGLQAQILESKIRKLLRESAKVTEAVEEPSDS